MGFNPFQMVQTIHEYTFNNEIFAPFHINTDAEGLLKAGTGATVWDSAIVLAKYLENNASKLFNSESIAMELGCGTGLAGLVCSHYCHNVLLTDKPNVTTLPKSTIRNNKQFSNVSVMDLEWSDRTASALAIERLSKHPDIVLFSDCITWNELYVDLIETLNTVCGNDTILIFANEKRDFQQESEFFRLLNQTFRFKNVDSEEQDTVYQSDDIYLFTASKK